MFFADVEAFENMAVHRDNPRVYCEMEKEGQHHLYHRGRRRSLQSVSFFFLNSISCIRVFRYNIIVIIVKTNRIKVRCDKPEHLLIILSINSRLIVEPAKGKETTGGDTMKISKKAFTFLLAVLMAFSFAACVSAAQASSFTAPKKLADYLYYMEYNDYSVNLKTGEHRSKPASRAPLCATETSTAVIWTWITPMSRNS